MPGKVLEFLIHLLLRDFDIFGGRDAVYDQLRLDVIRGALLLPPPESYPVDVDRARVDALRRQRAHHPLQPHVHLMLDQRLGNGEVVKFHEGGKDFLVQELFVLVIALMLEAFTNLLLQLIERRRIANVFGKFIVQLGQFFRFDAQRRSGRSFRRAWRPGNRRGRPHQNSCARQPLRRADFR